LFFAEDDYVLRLIVDIGATLAPELLAFGFMDSLSTAGIDFRRVVLADEVAEHHSTDPFE